MRVAPHLPQWVEGADGEVREVVDTALPEEDEGCTAAPPLERPMPEPIIKEDECQQ